MSQKYESAGMQPSRWTEVTVSGHPCDVYEPARRNEHGYVVIYLHGVHLQRLRDHPEFDQQWERHGLPVIAPMTKRSWWTNKVCLEFDPVLTAEQHVLQNVLPYIADRWQAKPPRIGLLGTSMGGQGALRLAYKFPDMFPVVAAIAPAIDYHLRLRDGDEVLAQMYSDVEAARQDTALLHVRALHWPRHQFFCCDPEDEWWWESAERLRMKLSALGIMHQCDLETSGGGHGFQYYCLMAEKAVAFIANGLERERLRVV